MEMSRRWSRLVELLMPLPLALYVNYRFVSPEPAPPLPNEAIFHQELNDLLERSEERLRSIENKGPGLAAVCAVVAATVSLAIATNWDRGGTLLRVLLVLSAVYALMSLWAPFVVLGPVKRHTITLKELERVAAMDDPTLELAQLKGESAAANSAEALRLANLQSASRDSLRNASVALGAWLLLVLFEWA